MYVQAWDLCYMFHMDTGEALVTGDNTLYCLAGHHEVYSTTFRGVYTYIYISICVTMAGVSRSGRNVT